jgi:hypothetical protein
MVKALHSPIILYLSVLPLASCHMGNAFPLIVKAEIIFIIFICHTF